MYMHGPAFNKAFTYREFHQAIDIPVRPVAVSEAPEGTVFVAVSTYESREEAIRASTDEILAGIPEDGTQWMSMPVAEAEKLVYPV